MQAHTCYHCKQWVEEDEPHDCWTTTEAALTAELGDDLREAWQRLRETAADFGEQRIYASHSSIMFARRACYFFVRPKRSFLEVNVFLGRRVEAPQVRKVIQSSAAKAVHVIQVRHRDEVEAPLTEWLEEAYHYVEAAPARGSARATEKAKPQPQPQTKTQTKTQTKRKTKTKTRMKSKTKSAQTVAKGRKTAKKTTVAKGKKSGGAAPRR